MLVDVCFMENLHRCLIAARNIEQCNGNREQVEADIDMVIGQTGGIIKAERKRQQQHIARKARTLSLNKYCDENIICDMDEIAGEEEG